MGVEGRRRLRVVIMESRGVGGATAWTGRGVGAPVAVKGGCSLAVGIEGGCVGPGVGTGGSLRVEIKYDALMRRMVAVS